MNVPAATFIVVAPTLEGVNMAVYTVLDIVPKLVKAPPETVISDTTKLVVASLEVNIKVIEELFEESPSLTSVAVIAIVGGVLSKVTLPDPLVTDIPWLPEESVKAIV